MCLFGIQGPAEFTPPIFGRASFAVAWGAHSLMWKLPAVQHMRVLFSNLAVGAVAGSVDIVDAYGLLLALGVDDLKVILKKDLRRGRKTGE